MVFADMDAGGRRLQVQNVERL